MFIRHLSLILALSLSSVAFASDTPPKVDAALGSYSIHEAEASGKAAQMERSRAKGLVSGKSWAPLLDPSPIDVTKYSIQLFLDFDREVVSGSVEVAFQAVEPAVETVNLDAWSGLRVLGITLLEDPAFPFDSPIEIPFNHQGDVLSITLPQPLSAGNGLRIRISYGGRAGYRGDGINWDYHGSSQRVAWTMAEPFGARVWWPCNDRPDDKAIVDVTITAPSEYTVASNGLMEGMIDHGDGQTTTRWASVYPVAPYLVVMNAADFVYSEETYVSEQGTTMPVALYAFPEVAEQAEIDLEITPDMIETMAALFGEYPFVDEKYGNCTANFGGGMEHQTLTTISASAIGTSWMPWLNVHELGHQWWGDWVTCSDWRELWLNEGFATLTEWLWAEHLGESTLQNYLRDSDQIGLFLGPVYDNPIPFSGTVYDKGAWVLRMMRHLLGDEDFFDGVATYRQAHAGQAATSEDLKAAFETVSGRDLEQFFQQWVYGENRPRFQYSWEPIEGPTIRLVIDQIQSNAELFEMPLEIRVSTTAGNEDHRIELAAVEQQTIEIPLASTPTGVTFDPNRWSLFIASSSDQPSVDLGPDAPGPFDCGLASIFSPSTITIPLTNAGGSPLEVYDWGFSDGSDFNITAPTQLPFTLAPGESVDVEITFRAGGFGNRANWMWLLSNDPNNSGFSYARITGTGTLFPGVNLQWPSSVNFRQVPIFGDQIATFDLTNMGEESVALSSQIEGEEFSLLTPIPQVSEPGTRHTVLLRYSPEEIGSHEGILVLHTDDPVEPTIEIDLRGTGISAPHIRVEPSTLAFGIVAQSQGAVLRISNDGTEDLQLLEARVEGSYGLADNTVFPAIVGPDQHVDLLMFQTSEETGATLGTLRLRSTDPGLPWASIPLSSISVPEPIDPQDHFEIPATASTAGLGGAWWSTDVVLLNTSETDAAADLKFSPSGPSDNTNIDQTVTILARTQRTLSDVVAELGYQGAGGMTVTASDQEIILTTRTAAEDSGQTFGQTISPILRGDAQQGLTTSVLSGLSSGDGFHSNLGLYNLSDQRITVTFEVYSSAGASLGEITLTAAAGAFTQRISALETLNAGVLRGAWAKATSSESTDLFTCYASVVDDQSHDPTFIPATLIDQATGDLILPAVAAQPGLHQTRWATELTLANPSDTEVQATLSYHTADGLTTETVERLIPEGAAFYANDLLREIFGVEGSGWLEIHASGPLVSGCRIFNNAAEGSFGQFIPASPILSQENQGTYVVPGLRSDDGFRTNLGLTSYSEFDTTVDVTMYSSDGVSLGTENVVLPAGAFIQLVEVLDQQFGFEGSAWAEVTATDPEVLFSAHASVIDGSTGDPSFIPGSER